MKNAVGYVRVSTADQAKEGVSLEAQADRLRAYCQMRGLNLVEIIADEGVSGTVPFCEREGGRKVLAMVKAGMVTEIIGLKLDRLFRNAHDALGKLGEWDKAKVGLHLVDMGGAAVDTRSAMRRMMLTMLAGFAQFERDLVSERTTAALQHKRKTNRPYGHTPLGFDKVEDGERADGSKTYRLERNEEEAALVARIHALKAEGKSLLGIANTLNGEGIRGKTGGRFYASTIKAILGNAAAPAAA